MVEVCEYEQPQRISVFIPCTTLLALSNTRTQPRERLGLQVGSSAEKKLQKVYCAVAPKAIAAEYSPMNFIFC